MKRLIAYDFDGTLMDSPEPNPGKEIWKEKTGQEYPHKGWWGRKESLNTDIFEINTFPTILNQLKQDVADSNAHVIILTSRLEKLRPEVEKIMKKHNINVDAIVMKSGPIDKGDILLNYAKNNSDLEEITIYDDFANGQKHKIEELTKIKEILPNNIQYNIYYVKDGKFRLMESTNHLKEMIFEEMIKFKS